MTNKQYLVIAEIVKQLKTVTGMVYVGEYPDDITKRGQKFPCCIVEDGNESFLIKAGNKYDNTMLVHVHFYCQLIVGKTKMKNLLDIQALINNKILGDLTIGGTCLNSNLESVTKETIENQGQMISHRIITYSVLIQDDRV
jgi:hypothetical protein